MKFKTPYLVQRMEMLSKDNCVPFGQRFRGDYMGSAHFEVGEQGRSLCRLHEKAETTIVTMLRHPITVMFNPDNWDREGIIHILTELLSDKIRCEEPTYFRADFLSGSSINAWHDIKNDLIWVLGKVSEKDLLRNIRLSVEWMDKVKARKDAEKEMAQSAVSAKTSEPISPIRQRLIDAGVIKPAAR